MIPREKAAQLVVDNQIKVRSLDYKEAVQCAIVTVDEIILEQCKSSEFKDAKYQDERIHYWIEVKEELKKL